MAGYLDITDRQHSAPEYVRKHLRSVAQAIIVIFLVLGLALAFLYHEYRGIRPTAAEAPTQLADKDSADQDCTTKCNGAPVFFQGHGPLTFSRCSAASVRLKKYGPRGLLFWKERTQVDATPADFNLDEPGRYVCEEMCSFDISSPRSSEDILSFPEFVRNKIKGRADSSRPTSNTKKLVKANFVRIGNTTSPTCHFRAWADAPQKTECKTPKCKGKVSIGDHGSFPASNCYVSAVHRGRLESSGMSITPGDFELSQDARNTAGEYVCMETCSLSIKGVTRSAFLVRDGEAHAPSCEFFGWEDAKSAI